MFNPVFLHITVHTDNYLPHEFRALLHADFVSDNTYIISGTIHKEGITSHFYGYLWASHCYWAQERSTLSPAELGRLAGAISTALGYGTGDGKAFTIHVGRE